MMQEHPHESELRALLSRRLRMDLSGIDLDASLNEALGIDSLTGLEVMVHVTSVRLKIE